MSESESKDDVGGLLLRAQGALSALSERLSDPLCIVLGMPDEEFYQRVWPSPELWDRLLGPGIWPDKLGSIVDALQRDGAIDDAIGWVIEPVECEDGEIRKRHAQKGKQVAIDARKIAEILTAFATSIESELVDE